MYLITNQWRPMGPPQSMFAKQKRFTRIVMNRIRCKKQEEAPKVLITINHWRPMGPPQSMFI